MEIHRHPFGLIGLYAVAVIIAAAVLAAAALIPHYATSLSTHDKSGIFLGAVIIIVVLLLYTYVAVTIYKGNRWIVSSDSITQISQTGLFRKQTSQLSLANLEDVTFEQNSFLQSMFGFGTLKVETAGERSKFYFVFCPNPQDCAKRIIQAHEQFIVNKPDEMAASTRALNSTPQPAYGQPPAAPPSPMEPQQPPVGYTVPTGSDDDTRQNS